MAFKIVNNYYIIFMINRKSLFEQIYLQKHTVHLIFHLISMDSLHSKNNFGITM